MMSAHTTIHAQTVAACVSQHAERRPDKVAIRRIRPGHGDDVWTWRELDDAWREFALAFSEHLAGNAVVPAFASKSPLSVAAFIGCVASGRTFAFLNPKLRLPQVAHAIKLAKSMTALVDGQTLSVLATEDGLSSIVANTDWWLLEGAKLSRMAQASLSRLEKTSRVERWATLREKALAHERYHLYGTASDVQAAVCLFTSGSTGASKGVLVSSGDMLARACAEIELFELGESDVLLSLLPFSFDVGLNQLVTALVAGCELIVLDSWMPKDILRVVSSFNVTGVSGVPSIWMEFVRNGRESTMLELGHCNSLRYLTISGGDMPKDYLSRLSESAKGIHIFKTYGQTESFRSTALKPHEFEKKHLSVGRPFGSANVYVVRQDGSLADSGEEGEIVHTGLGTMLGYLDDRESSTKLRQNPIPRESDENPLAVFTGDIGCFDEDGFLYLRGRRDDLVKVKGNRLHLGELSASIMQMDGVFRAETVAVRGEDGDHLLAAFVVPSVGSEQLDSDAVAQFVSARLPSYMWLHLSVILRSMPLTASGKPDRALLLEQARSMFARDNARLER